MVGGGGGLLLCPPLDPVPAPLSHRRSSTTSAARSWSRCSRWISSTWRRRSTRSSCALVRAGGAWGGRSGGVSPHCQDCPDTHPHPAVGAGEEEITFPPTYRYERGSRDTYVWHKQKPTGVGAGGWGMVRVRGDPSLTPPTHTHSCPCQVRTNVPSWCDRILWKSYPETHVNCNAYGELCVPLLGTLSPPCPGDRLPAPPPQTDTPPSRLAAGCTDDIVTSDHSPVFGSFEVGVTSQFVSKKGACAQGDTPFPSLWVPSLPQGRGGSWGGSVLTPRLSLEGSPSLPSRRTSSSRASRLS